MRLDWTFDIKIFFWHLDNFCSYFQLIQNHYPSKERRLLDEVLGTYLSYSYVYYDEQI